MMDNNVKDDNKNSSNRYHVIRGSSHHTNQVVIEISLLNMKEMTKPDDLGLLSGFRKMYYPISDMTALTTRVP